MVRWQDWDGATTYPDTLRDLWAYLPHGYDGRTPANLLVCNDGAGYLSARAVRVTRVLDTLHHGGEIAPTVAVFVNPGRPRGYTPAPGPPTARYNPASLQRRLEYDALTPTYARFCWTTCYPTSAPQPA